MDIFEKIREFFATGNNLYYVIAGAVALIAVIAVTVIAVSVAKKKKKKAAAAEKPEIAGAPEREPVTYDPSHEGEIDVDKLVVRSESDYSPEVNENFTMRLPVRYDSPDVDSVVMTPLKNPEKEPEPASVPEPEAPKEKESSFKDHVYSPEAGKRPGTIQIYTDAGGKYRFRMKTSNGETVGHSQGYTSKSACKNGIKAVINAARIAERADATREDYVSVIGKTVFVIYRDRENKFRFRLTAANASNILASQGYTSKANCINGTESVRHVAAFHNLADDTLKKVVK